MSIPRPEYPNPQFARADWMNLNGTWQFENQMLSYIRDGETEKLRAFLRATAAKTDLQTQAGTLASDPLRQAKNLLIGLTAVVGKVAGIGGGTCRSSLGLAK